MTKTLKTLVSNTVLANSVKLNATAGRIGLGLAVVGRYPAEPLSPEQPPLLHGPDSDSDSVSRQECPAMQMRPQMQTGNATGATAGSAGRLSFPGSSARRRPPSFTGRPSWGWCGATKRATAAARSAANPGNNSGFAVLPPAGGKCGASFPVAFSLQMNRIGRDCQSPDRGETAKSTLREVRHAPATGK
jgi:hypothetical protein